MLGMAVRRLPITLTFDPDWRARADKMAEARGLSLSVFLEQLVRAEYERERQAKEERRERREGRS
jgi:hypothetical protein